MADLEPLPLKDAAERLGTSVQALRMRAKRGKIASAMVNGRMVVYVPSPTPPEPLAPDLEALADLIADRVTQRVASSLALPAPAPVEDGERGKLQAEVQLLRERQATLVRERDAISQSRAEYMIRADKPKWPLFFWGVLAAFAVIAAALWLGIAPPLAPVAR